MSKTLETHIVTKLMQPLLRLGVQDMRRSLGLGLSLCNEGVIQLQVLQTVHGSLAISARPCNHVRTSGHLICQRSKIMGGHDRIAAVRPGRAAPHCQLGCIARAVEHVDHQMEAIAMVPQRSGTTINGRRPLHHIVAVQRDGGSSQVSAVRQNPWSHAV
ncbi:hypothetical protein MRB53_042126 [Persea americana]|nr:hypothetical protein MRB53_042126 [Persea americana]